MDISRQQVKAGKANANEIVITEGLEEGDQVYLSIPQQGKDRPVVLLEREENKGPALTNAGE
jgi:hypothetical protein